MQLATHCLALLLSAAVPERPDDAPTPPKGPAPRFMTIQKVDAANGRVALAQPVTQVVPVQVTEQVIQNGMAVVVTKVVYQTQSITTSSQVPLKDCKAETAAGQKLAGDEITARLREGTTVLVSSDGRPIDPAYLRLLNPATLILIFPPQGMAGVGVPPPAPLAPAFPPAPPRN